MNVINVSTKKMLKEFYNDNSLTVEGLDYKDPSMEDFINYVDEIVTLKEKTFYVISGETMNKQYNLTGDNKYPDDLHIVVIKLSDMEHPNNIVLKRFEFGGRWFNDVVDNNARREKEKL